MNEGKISSLQLISVRWWNASAYYAVTLAEILRSRGLKTVLGGSRNSPPLAKAQEKQIPVRSFQFESLYPWNFFYNLQILKKTVSETSPDIIDAHRPEDHFYSAFFRTNGEAKPLIRTVGDVRPPKKHYFNKKLHLNHTDFFIFSCHASRKRYQDTWPIPDNKTAVIYAGVDTDFFRPIEQNRKTRQTLGIPDDAFVFGMVGRLSPVKNHATFLQAAAKFNNTDRKTYYIISGEEVEISGKELMQQAGASGIADRIKIVGKYTDVRDIIGMIDVGVVCSSDSEAISRITAEFMAMNRPVIVSKINVLPEMITEGREGYIVPADSPDILYGKMKLMLDNPDSVREMGRQARTTAVDRFSFDRFYTDTLRIYEQVLNVFYRHGVSSS